jgi:hypothetical protein
MSLDYRPMLLSHQLFRETVPLRQDQIVYLTFCTVHILPIISHRKVLEEQCVLRNTKSGVL